MELGLRADQRLGDDPGARPQTRTGGGLFVHQQHRGRTVGDLRRRARGVNTARQHRLQLGQPRAVGVAQALIAVHVEFLAGEGALLVHLRRGDGEHLALEAALGPGLGGQSL